MLPRLFNVLMDNTDREILTGYFGRDGSVGKERGCWKVGLRIYAYVNVFLKRESRILLGNTQE